MSDSNGVVTIRLMKDGKIVHQMFAHPDQGFVEYAPGGIKTTIAHEESGMVIAIPAVIEIDEVIVRWPVPSP